MSSVPPLIGPDNFESFIETSSPYVVARINGATYAVVDFSVDENAHGATNLATMDLPITGNPDFSKVFADIGGTSVSGELFVGRQPSPPALGKSLSIAGLKRVYSGLVAQYDPKFATDRVTFTLRSLASPLVDQKIQKIVTNVTTVDFIQAACEQYGLKFVSLLGSSPITVQQVLGAMYIDPSYFAAAVHGMRIWDLMLSCAQFDGVDLWEDQGTVYYAAPDLIPRQTIDIKYGRDLSIEDGLIGSHALMFSKDVQVEARSAQQRASKSSAVRVAGNADGSVSVSAVSKITTGSPQWGTPDVLTTTYYPDGSTTTTKRTTTGGSFSTGLTSQGREPTTQRYIIYPKNKDPAALNALAAAQWKKITQQEYTVQIRFPFTKAKGIVPLSSLIRLHNVPYAKFNGIYYPRKITLSGGSNRPFMYEIDAINHTLAQGAL